MYYDKLACRTDKGDTPYNLRSCEYMEDFSKHKIIYSETNNANSTKIFLDKEGFVTDKTCFIIKADEIKLNHIYKIMSSEIFTWYMKIVSPCLGSQGISLTKESVETFPLCDISNYSPKDSYRLTTNEMNYIHDSLSK